MARRFFLLCLTLLFVSALSASARKAIDYTLRFTDADAHYLDVEAAYPSDGKDSLTLFMPVWTPGSYLVREYARNLIDIQATSLAGTALPIEKISKNRWTITTQGQDRVRVRYRLFAREINVRGNWIERDFSVLNGAPTFLTLADDYQRPYTVRLELPAGWKGSYTALAPAAGPNSYTAPDFDTLVDSPILAGSPLVDNFEVDGVRHTLVTLGGDGVWDNARVARNLARLVEEQRSFWGSLPYRTPYYFLNLLTGSRGGLEHANGVLISADRWLARNRSGINSWLSLASHEYFHSWNGKRLRPVEFGPFDYERESYSKSLWIVEGITSYYQHVLLARAGFYSHDDYLGAVSGSIAGVQKTPGRRVQSLSDSSFDAWIKAYRPDENSINALFSYYSGGSIAALLLDVEIRRVTDGSRSLDDVIRAAYARYSGERGYTEGEFIALASEITGHDLSTWFARVIQSPGDFDYQPLLEWYGLLFEKPADQTKTSPNKIEPADPAKGWLGADTKNDAGRLVVTSVRSDMPAAKAGVYVDDEILAIDRYRVRPEQFTSRLGAYAPGDRISLLVARRDEIITLPVTLEEEPRETWRLKIDPKATDAQKARMNAWLGENTPPGNPPATAAGS